MAANNFHVAMYPWFALGHLTSYLHISNKLAERGHKISFLMPRNTISKLEHFNLHSDRISFIPISIPDVDGLPRGSETTADLPFSLHSLLMTAMDLTEPIIEDSLRELKPHMVFFDFTYWLPALARRFGIKALHYCTISPATVGYLISPERKLHEKPLTEDDLLNPPPGFPPSSIKLKPHEARGLATSTLKGYGKDISFMERQLISFTSCDAIIFKTSREMEGPYCDYLEKQMRKQVFLAGPVLPDPPTSTLEEKWVTWLGGFKPKTVIFCAFGSECILKSNQFKELLLGFELTGMPFLAALKPSIGAETMELALPEGFSERIKGRGVVEGDWVQQQLILSHPSVGCFVTHCGSGSLTEAMVNDCQLVLLPHAGDQFINARIMSGDLKVGIEVGKNEEDGLFTREAVCKAVRTVTDSESELGHIVRKNHAQWREFLLSQGLENSYVDDLVQKLHSLLKS
ncbi:cyanidin 3-O-galactoside 2''-O-xylosyltransferase FGGT1-like [Vicia villosa]|uniref:cyanidin 3-O-galactoside 2''-O-xylosyltransferase FGGT1-like n=1 Tax=Vicia villosa TaxID=3911 RepID=UPI00273A9D0E|nr:cyanidin 3-O-galactoside 2''-O-xylosyltransferase FGGT1-like [Vicia villosa]XP_058771508.1 cyanidin 3-O-galactoside 2''-O-xylosyltransferase FGGT1-like [Vicia villosa]